MAVDCSGLTGQDRLYFQAVKNSPFKLELGGWQLEADRMEVSGDMDEDFEPSGDLLPVKRSGKCHQVAALLVGIEPIEIWLVVSRYTRCFRASRQKAQRVDMMPPTNCDFLLWLSMSIYVVKLNFCMNKRNLPVNSQVGAFPTVLITPQAPPFDVSEGL